MKRFYFFFCFLIITCSFSPLFASEIFYANETADILRSPAPTRCDSTDACSLREAILLANSLSTTILDPHRIILKGEIYTLSIPDSIDPMTMETIDDDQSEKGDLDLNVPMVLDVNSSSSNAQATLEGDNAFNSRILEIPQNNQVLLSHLVIKKGKAPIKQNGGGILNGGTVTLNSVIVSNSETINADGGGIFNTGHGILVLENSIVQNNLSRRDGGGIYNEGNLTLKNSQITGNITSSSGGGIASLGILKINSSIVEKNESQSKQELVAGLFLFRANATIENGSIIQNNVNTRNTANVGDDFVFNIQSNSDANGTSTLKIDHSTITIQEDPISQAVDRCINLMSEGNLEIISSTLYTQKNCTNENQILFIRHARPAIPIQNKITISNSTLSGFKEGIVINDSETASPPNLNFSHSTLFSSENNASGLVIQGSSGAAIIQATHTLLHRCNLNGNNSLQSLGFNIELEQNCQLNQTGDLSNISLENLHLTPLSNHGGFTLTHALLPESIAIDRSDSNLCPSVDQRDLHRIKGIKCDVGAYEAIGSSELLQVQPGKEIIFPDTELGKISEIQIVLTNAAEIPLKIPTLSIGTSNAFDFNLADCSGKTLFPNSNCTIKASFAPNAVVDFSASFEILTDVANDSLLLVFKGKGISATSSFNSIALSESELSFAKVNSNEISKRTLFIKNIGKESLSIKEISIEGDQKENFSFSGCINSNLAPQSSCPIDITFSPKTSGSFKAQLNILVNGISNRMMVSLNGSSFNNESSTSNAGGCEIIPFTSKNQTVLPLYFASLAILILIKIKRAYE